LRERLFLLLGGIFPVWNPCPVQPVFPAWASVGGRVAEALFRDGLCLPSGANLGEADLERVVEVVYSVHR